MAAGEVDPVSDFCTFDLVDFIVTHGSWATRRSRRPPSTASPQTRLFQKYTDTARTPTPSTSTSAPTRPIHGVECKSYPVPKNKNSLLVADMSSNYCSKPVDDSSFGLIYAGAQKNIGPSGVTIVIVRNNLLGSAQPSMPTDHPLDYKMPTPPRPCLPPPSCQGRPRFHKRSLAASHLCCCRRADSAGPPPPPGSPCWFANVWSTEHLGTSAVLIDCGSLSGIVLLVSPAKDLRQV
ncbi:putative phosphoserine aminotransferase 1, chloroplastic [Iris pallida]|uniref:Phosphoserine aminotransferase 1, chloroplastic n=1 Tax=Iris pallida TaxID=29817 RepID=A0AAX6HD58_IRIPA|nr:putative phosphoserine aminotransferase 1, chloroplastic [Iris pallida]